MDVLYNRFLLLGALWLQPSQAGSHSLLYFLSSLSEEVPGVPRFSIVGFVDDVPIEGYSSDTRRMEPRAPWVKKAVDPQYWEKETEISRGWETLMKNKVLIAMDRANQTRGLHTLQEMYGCELLGDGAIGGFYEYAYDGGDYLSFDKDEMRFRATAAPAQISADHWNLDKIQAQREKAYLEGTCIEWLRKYLHHGKETLLRRVPPGTMVSRRKSGDRTLLTCYAYGFYPREIEVKWIRSGVEMPLEWSQLLPNPDGTYQIKATVEVQEGDEKNMYECQVEHSSLPEIVTVVYVSPGTMVSRRKSGDRTLLTCYAYGFYPREIEVKWIRSGVEMPLEWSQLLPNPDGTYQIKATVEVQEGDEKNMYECQVEHSSLPEIVTVVYKEKSPGPRIEIIAGVILADVLAVGLAVFLIWFAFFRDKHPVKAEATLLREKVLLTRHPASVLLPEDAGILERKLLSAPSSECRN
ncbi:major histocompatibility complex class I-related gene protein-like isoform X2 [Ambystoma mexicanum]|uniref:major histocompatibility complex class I-related gene protein-like isoform X2 n=1 Tax=Ambystoma mexicanum TaxID=8296 RepID=UPI0037E7C610